MAVAGRWSGRAVVRSGSVQHNRAMPRTTYGNTWWGRQWLQALAHIDFDNRLPRGRTYANKGAVRDLSVVGGTITARVQGSRPQPYAVTVSVPPLGAKDAGRLLDRLAADPALIARLLNRELDPAVLDAAQALGVDVFPTRWRDLAMRCSCPDAAVPCKHLAAVVYLLSREIDGDPFLVFSLRGLDLAQALAACDVHIGPAPALPTLHDLLAGDAAPQPDEADAAALGRLDFSAVPELGQALWRVLPASPAFFPAGDFRETGQRVLARVAKAARRALQAAVAPGGDDFDAQDQPVIVLDAAGTAAVAGLVSGTPKDGFAALADRLGRLAPQRLPDLQPALGALHVVRLLALHLLARGAVVPQVHATDGGVALRWLPATLDAAVDTLLRQLATGLPAGLVRLAPRGDPVPPKKRRGTAAGPAALPLPAGAQALALCSLFLDHCVHAWSEIGLGQSDGDRTLALFFGSGRARYDGPGEGAVAGGIQAWLSRLHPGRHEHAPLLRLEEGGREDGFALTLAVERRGAAEPPVGLEAVLREPGWAKARYAVLRQVAVLAEFHPPLAAHVRAGAVDPVAIDAAGLPALPVRHPARAAPARHPRPAAAGPGPRAAAAAVDAHLGPGRRRPGAARPRRRARLRLAGGARRPDRPACRVRAPRRPRHGDRALPGRIRLPRPGGDRAAARAARQAAGDGRRRAAARRAGGRP